VSSLQQYNTGITAVVPAWWDFIWGDIVYLQLAGAPAPIAVPPDDPLFAVRAPSNPAPRERHPARVC